MTPEQKKKELPEPLKFVKNSEGAWVVDDDISFGCWTPVGLDPSNEKSNEAPAPLTMVKVPPM